MATAETSSASHVRHSRRRPFTTWMKRLTNLKGSSSSSDSQSGSKTFNTGGRNGGRNNGDKNNSSSSSTNGNNNNNNNNHNHGSILKGGNRRHNRNAKNNPYPLSGTIRDFGSPRSNNDTVSYAESSDTGGQGRRTSQQSMQASVSEQNIPGNSAKSTAPTLSTNGDTTRSEAGYSKAGTTMTGRGGTYGGGEGSTFSSPASSARSLTTTLTTVQSAAPSVQIYGIAQHHPNANGSVTSAGAAVGGMAAAAQNGNTIHHQTQFSHAFPPSPASAVPPHLAATGLPATYSSATANNILTDNASILTLASSSKRRRRNSLDTNASVRALAPSSVFGGSRESLPLSVLSANAGGVDASNASITNASGVHSRQSLGGLASAERISVYSASGTVPPLVHGGGGGDRSSLIASKQGDNGSVRSGTHSHTRNDSAAGSVAGTIGSTLNSAAVSNNVPTAITSPSSGAGPGRISRRSSGWGEITGEEDGDRDDAGASAGTGTCAGNVNCNEGVEDDDGVRADNNTIPDDDDDETAERRSIHETKNSSPSNTTDPASATCIDEAIPKQQ